MATDDKTTEQLRLDERNHVEQPLLNQLADLSWEIVDNETEVSFL